MRIPAMNNIGPAAIRRGRCASVRKSLTFAAPFLFNSGNLSRHSPYKSREVAVRKLLLLTLVLAASAACGSEVAATGAADQNSPTEPVATATAITAQPTATTSAGVPDDLQADIDRQFGDLRFRLSSLERLMSAGDGMFSLEDDLANADGRLRAQQRCINALVLVAGSHQHLADADGGVTGPGQFGVFGAEGLDATTHARMLAVECGPAVDESLLAQLADDYGIELK